MRAASVFLMLYRWWKCVICLGWAMPKACPAVAPPGSGARTQSAVAPWIAYGDLPVLFRSHAVSCTLLVTGSIYDAVYAQAQRTYAHSLRSLALHPFVRQWRR